MELSFVYRCCGTALLAATVSACSGVTPQPTVSNSIAQTTAFRAAGGSMGRLIYVSDSGTNTVYFYSYRSGKLKGSFSVGLSEPQGLCSDEKGNVWLANTAESDVVEYAHGATTPKQTLATTGQYPVGCSVDKKGDVAVSDIETTAGGEGNVEIFKGGKGTPTPITCSNVYRYYFLAYDTKGNVWVDGSDESGVFGLCEIKAGASSGTAITVNTPPEFPGAVQWDGTYIVIEDQETGAIDRFRIRGTTGTLKGTVVLNGASFGFFLPSRDRVLSFLSGSQGIGFFKYPAGGNAIKTLPLGGLSEPVGFTVSPTSIL